MNLSDWARKNPDFAASFYSWAAFGLEDVRGEDDGTPEWVAQKAYELAFWMRARDPFLRFFTRLGFDCVYFYQQTEKCVRTSPRRWEVYHLFYALHQSCPLFSPLP